MGEETPTIADLPHHRGRPASREQGAIASRPTPPPIERTFPLPGPEATLRQAEQQETGRLALGGVLLNCLGLVAMSFVGGDALARNLCTAALAGALLNNLWLWFATRRRERLDDKHLLVYFGLSPFFNAGVLYYIGVFGPILVIFVLNVYMTCLGYSRRVARLALAGSLAPFLALAIAFSFGWLADPGLMTGTEALGRTGRLFVTGLFVVFLFLIYQQASATRGLIVASLRERDEAVRQASHREALVLEARQDLERALQAGGLGRFTDQTLGSFKLGAVLGRGGMGEVYEATHVPTGEPAAVKMLLPEVIGRPDYVRRFMREVRIAASLDSPHVVRVIEIGDESAALPYLAMERLRGEDLAQLLRRDEGLGHRDVMEMVRQVGKGLAAATAAGIVHRDLKPQNLFRCAGEPPVWKILDFGVSKLVEAGSTLTEGEAVGTPHYMAPEQAKGGEVGPAADLYALGAIVYRTLTGHLPFHTGTVGEVMISTVATMPVRPSALARLPRDVDLVLAIAMAKDPRDRFASPAHFTDAIEGALTGNLDEAARKHGQRLVAVLPWSEPDRR